MTKIIYCFIIACSFTIGCTKNDTTTADCGIPASIDKEKYDNRTLQDSLLNIIEEPIIENNCLTLVVGYSGCNNKHNLTLIGDGSIAKSLPVQTNFKILDSNQELCEAYFTDTYSFDLSGLKERFKNEKSVRLNFLDQNKSVLWQIE